jgi:hypothetical protein
MQKQKTRWSNAEDRRLIQLAASSKSLEAIAYELNRSPESVAQMAKRLRISLRSAAELKAKTKWTGCGSSSSKARIARSRTAYAFGPGNLPERAKAWSGTGHPRFARRRADGEREPKRGFSSSPRERLRRRHDIGLKVKKWYWHSRLMEARMLNEYHLQFLRLLNEWH